ncbi:ABC transporter permease [Tunicatimonas pelagia]|uniref:ABC transporter permease n=1 Tax=Tunicatimonas pelagia TaxID=931531 RepID=UPI0026661C24|nr:ABC transporter permease [Tunicatimonas pelagia]WKN44375.1 ABC transporter permease [Tunicatimonas pelagia]
MSNQSTPPKLPLRFFRWYCHPDYAEDIEGDLWERYERNVEEKGERAACWRFAQDVTKLFRPGIIRPFCKIQPINHTAMFQNYFKIGWRNLLNHKGYSVINVLGLTLGITGAILIFTLVKYHLSFDTFHSKADRIYRVTTEFHQEEISRESNVPQPIGKALRDDYTFAEKIAMVYSDSDWLVSVPSSEDDKKFKEHIAFAEPEFFDILDFPLVQGDKNTILTEPNTAVITERIAEKLFGDQNPIDQMIRVQNKLDFRITGVLQDLPINTDRRDEIYLSYSSLKEYNAWLAGDSWQGIAGGMHCFMLLKPDVPPSEVNETFPELSKKYYNERDAEIYQFKLQHISDIHFNPDLGGYIAKKNLWALSLIGLFLIITACVNFINLATAQALRRAKEIGVRKALGSKRGQLFWQFITETALITILALVLAYAFAQLALPYLNQLLNIQLQINIFQDIYLLTFLPILLLVVIVLSGSYPGLIMAGFQPVMALKGKLSQKHAGGFSLRRGLVITQFVISQLLIIGTIVIANQVRYSRQADMGFAKDAIVMLPVPEKEKSTISALDSEISQLADVEKIAFCSRAPASEGWASVDVRYSSRTENENFDITVKAGDHQYVPTFDLQIVAGRNLQPSDTVREFLINETAVRRFGEHSPEDVIGKRVWIGLNGSEGTIVGVVKDFHNRSFHETIDPLCITTSTDWYSSCAVKINPGNLQSTLSDLETSWVEVFPNHVFEYSFLDEQIARFYETDNMIFRLIQIFASIAIIIGCLGLYGLVSFMAAQKTKEVGVRKVLGASLPSILWLFGKEFTRLLILAFVIAAPLAWWVMQNWLENFTYRIEIGGGIFALAIAATFLIAMLTVSFQSVRAALANPVDSLRNE